MHKTDMITEQKSAASLLQGLRTYSVARAILRLLHSNPRDAAKAVAIQPGIPGPWSDYA